jgi:hypothetical protein
MSPLVKLPYITTTLSKVLCEKQCLVGCYVGRSFPTFRRNAVTPYLGWTSKEAERDNVTLPVTSLLGLPFGPEGEDRTFLRNVRKIL